MFERKTEKYVEETTEKQIEHLKHSLSGFQGGVGKCTTPVEDKDIVREVEKITSTISVLQEVAKRLIEKLEPLRKQQIRCESEKEKSESLSPFAEFIRQERYKIEAVHTMLFDCLQDIQI